MGGSFSPWNDDGAPPRERQEPAAIKSAPKGVEKFEHLETLEDINGALREDMSEFDKRALHFVATRMLGFKPNKKTGRYE